MKRSIVKKSVFSLVMLMSVLGVNISSAEVIMTEQEALTRAFPDHDITRMEITLDETQTTTVQNAARSLLPSQDIVYFEASLNGIVTGRAYLDTHIVRTEPETVLSVVNVNKELAMVMILTFLDHPDYIPGRRWLNTLTDHKLDSELQRGEGVPNMLGATLSVDGVINASRRALAIDTLIIEAL